METLQSWPICPVRSRLEETVPMLDVNIFVERLDGQANNAGG
jgi:hypothetical protein